PGRHHPHAGRGEPALERDLVVELERPDLHRARDPHAEVERERLLEPAVRDPGVVRPALSGRRGDAQRAGIERGHRALDRAARLKPPPAAPRNDPGVATRPTRISRRTKATSSPPGAFIQI